MFIFWSFFISEFLKLDDSQSPPQVKRENYHSLTHYSKTNKKKWHRIAIKSQ